MPNTLDITTPASAHCLRDGVTLWMVAKWPGYPVALEADGPKGDNMMSRASPISQATPPGPLWRCTCTSSSTHMLVAQSVLYLIRT